VKKIEAPLFPGYIFCRFCPEQRLSVLKTRGINSIVGFGNTPAAVSNDEIAAVRQVVASGLPAYPWRYVRLGERVRVSSGSLEGVSGILVREKGKSRVVVSVHILQRSVAVEVDRAVLSPM
jgi:transcription antitermination factor NusG